MASPAYALTDRYLRSEGRVLLTGVQALARLPIEQVRRDHESGLRTSAFLSGYPGSPLAGFDLELGRALELVADLRIVHKPAVNEELAASAVMGSQFVEQRSDSALAGVAGYWYGKAPGVDRAADALRHAVFAGTSHHGGAVAIVGDDPANKSSTLPSSSAATLVGLGMPLFYPGTSAECLELGLHAVAASRATGLWSALKVVTPVADGSGTVELPVEGPAELAPTMMVDGQPYVCRPSGHLLGHRLIDIEREIHEIRVPLAREYGAQNGLNQMTVDPPDAWIGIIASGFTYHETVQALLKLGLDDDRAIAAAGIRLLHLRMPVPFDPALVRRFAKGLREVLVVEGKDDAIETRVRDALYGVTERPVIVGKETPDGRSLVPSWGLLDADTIEIAVRDRLAPTLGNRLRPPAPAGRPLIAVSVDRTPYFCSGCPHNWSTRVPDGAEVGAGIGCHTMVLMMDEERVGHSIGITAMGNEGAQWTGMAPFVEADHIFQNLGDGTFFHSGQLAIQHAVAAGHHLTFKLLYNDTIAMTGGQTPTGQVGVGEIATILLAQGVTRVAVTTDAPDDYSEALPDGVKTYDRREILDVQEQLRAMPGVTVLIHDQDCAAETRRARRRGLAPTPTRRVVINQRICEGCGDCAEVSNCLSVQPVETPFGRKTSIDQASCNFDYSCLGGDCPAFMTVETSGPDEPRPAASPSPTPPPVENPDGTGSDTYTVRFAGIGGTGTVTTAQILATAAMLDGWHVRGLDQTGLSQKAGPVISDVVLSHQPRIPSNHVGRDDADVIVGLDALVAASDVALAAANPEATTVIVSTHQTPPGAMIANPAMPYPSDDELSQRLAGRSRNENNRFVDAHMLASRLVGDSSHANILLLGVVYQEGRIPVSEAAIEQAIELNGVQVEANLEAFRWGRQWVADPGSVTAALPTDETFTARALPDELARQCEEITPNPELSDLIAMLTADLIEYQDAAYASVFVNEVATAARAEAALPIEMSNELTSAVARNLHKLMAYKDEYEVARLMLLPEARTTVESVAGPGADFSWQLHPPMLRALGWRNKLAVSHRLAPSIRLLARGKRLRGKAIDPFGRTRLRREERRLTDEYRSTLAEVYAGLSESNISDATAIANLPDIIRGYESLKERRITEYRLATREALVSYAGHQRPSRPPDRETPE